ncbi:MAG: winged helix-turn-helix domain-containing protein [Sphingomicrobium sp.]
MARQTFPPSTLYDVVTKGGGGEKQLRAYNLCDGTRSQSEIAKELGLDAGNFSRSLARWVDAGIVIRVGEARETRPVHVYPLPASSMKKGAKGDGE